jgi:hypothetical protein
MLLLCFAWPNRKSEDRTRWLLSAFKRPAGEPMTRAMARTQTRPVSRRIAGVPAPGNPIDETQEIPAVSDGSAESAANAPSAAPQQVISIEETVPVQSCIERTLLQEVLRRESAEKDEDQGEDG